MNSNSTASDEIGGKIGKVSATWKLTSIAA